MERKPIRNIEDFQVYQKAVKLFEDFLEKDLPVLQKSFAGRVLASNQLRSLDSICANMGSTKLWGQTFRCEMMI